MKKILTSMLLSWAVASHSATFVLDYHPGLAAGDYSFAGSYAIPSTGGHGNFILEGMFQYGFYTALADVNSTINDDDKCFNSPVRISLTCGNHAQVNYTFSDQQVHQPGNIVLKAPANCG